MEGRLKQMTLKEKRKAYHLFKPQTDLYVPGRFKATQPVVEE